MALWSAQFVDAIAGAVVMMWGKEFLCVKAIPMDDVLFLEDSKGNFKILQYADGVTCEKDLNSGIFTIKTMFDVKTA